jgi:hypothetical protein
MECLPIQVLDPFRIDIAIKDDPVSLTAFTTDVINKLAQDVGEQPVVGSSVPYSASLCMALGSMT